MEPSEPSSRPAWVALGANLGEPQATIEAAMLALAAIEHTTLEARSSLYRSAPVEATGPEFINAVARLRTRLDPEGLLRALQAIEARFGRERPYPNAPRTLDLDLLMVASLVHDSSTLTLPHPRMARRAFVLAPLVEIDPDLVVPGHGRAANLLRACAGQSITRLESPG